MKVVAYVPDLMDRSRFDSTGPKPTFVSSPGSLAAAAADADVVVLDLGRPGAIEAAEALKGRRIVGFISHVDQAGIARAEAAGVEVLPRSRFFSAANLKNLLG